MRQELMIMWFSATISHVLRTFFFFCLPRGVTRASAKWFIRQARKNALMKRQCLPFSRIARWPGFGGSTCCRPVPYCELSAQSRNARNQNRMHYTYRGRGSSGAHHHHQRQLMYGDLECRVASFQGFDSFFSGWISKFKIYLFFFKIDLGFDKS